MQQDIDKLGKYKASENVKQSDITVLEEIISLCKTLQFVNVVHTVSERQTSLLVLGL